MESMVEEDQDIALPTKMPDDTPMVESEKEEVPVPEDTKTCENGGVWTKENFVNGDVYEGFK